MYKLQFFIFIKLLTSLNIAAKLLHCSVAEIDLVVIDILVLVSV